MAENNDLVVKVSADIKDMTHKFEKAVGELTKLKESNKKAQAELKKFREENTKASNEVGNFTGFITKGVDGLKDFAAGAASAGAAILAFDKFINSNQVTLDKWQSLVTTATSVVDGAFNNLANGSLRDYIRNLDLVISKQKQAANAGIKSAYSVMGRGLKQDRYDYQHTVLEGKLLYGTPKEQKQAKIDLEKLNKDYIGDVQKYGKEQAQNVATQLNAQLTSASGGKFTSLSPDQWLKYLDQFLTNGGYDRYTSLGKQANKFTGGLQQSAGNTGFGSITTNVSRTPEALAIWKSEEYNVLKSLATMSRESLGALVQTLSDSISAQEWAISQHNSNASDLLGGTSVSSGSGGIQYVQGGIKNMPSSGNISFSFAPVDLTDMQSNIQNATQEIADEINANPIKIEPFEPEPIKYDYEGKFSDMAENANSASEAFGNLSNMFTNMSESFDSEALQAAAVGVSTAASIAQVVATLASTYAKSLKGSVTVWDWIAGATAGAATLVATIATVKNAMKFADGGIVTGSKTLGDYNIARVNSGEMILNTSQQTKLFDMINTGSSNNNTFNGDVKFRIKGSDLYGVLKTYNDNR